MSTTGSGFRIEYIVEKGTYKAHVGNIFSQTYVQTNHQGSISVSMPSWQRQQVSVAIVPKMGQNETDSVLHLHFSPEYSCDIPGFFEFYVSTQGVFTKQLQSVQCASNNVSTATIKDGMALVLIYTSNFPLMKHPPTISWEVVDARRTNVSFIKTDGKQCGGVVEADSGVIQYKPDMNLEPLEECIWTILTKNSYMNVQLIKTGSVGCCDNSLKVLAVDPELGTLHPPSTLNQSLPDALILSSAAIVVFKAVGNLNRTGFLLEFDSSGMPNYINTTFVANHSIANSGKYSSTLSPLANVSQGFSKNIQIFTHSRNASEPVFVHVTANLQYGVYRKETDCIYETITVYDLDFNGLTQLAQLPSSEEMSDCLDFVPVGKLRPWFKTRSGAFIVVQKTVSPMPITSFDWQHQIDTPHNCEDIQRRFVEPMSGVYTIFPVDINVFNQEEGGLQVFCDMETDEGGWTVIQRRQESTSGDEVDFYRNWDEYAAGFGNLNDSFWLGLDHISKLTNEPTRYTLRVDLMDWNGEKRFAEYSSFKVTNSTDSYRLSVSGYSGNAGDSLYYHNGKQFSTKDNGDASSCANRRKGGYWYDYCTRSNLNGRYGQTARDEGLTWYGWHGDLYSLKRSEMKIRSSKYSSKG